MFSSLSNLDIFALAFFIIIWSLYSFLPLIHSTTYNLSSVIHRYRLQWVKNIVKKSNRGDDLLVVISKSKIASILMVVAFMAAFVCCFAIIKGEFEDVINFKLILMAVVFILAFFKFSWVIRQLSYILLLIEAAPNRKENSDLVADLKRQTRYVNKTAIMLSNIDKNYNSGIESLYLSFALIAWIINVWLFILASILIVSLLYYREYMSRSLILLS